MASKTLTINHAGGGSETYTINRDKFAGVRQMSVDGQSVEVDHTAVPKEQSRETAFGGTQSITIKRDIEPLLTNVVGGASAAYSLRDLNDKAGNSKVVKVRRSSDQAEKTFTAKEVPQIADWVNENDSGDVIGFTLSGSGDLDADGVYTLRQYVSGRPQFNKAHPNGSIWFFYVLSGSSGYWRLRVFESNPNDPKEDPADTILTGVVEDTDYPWETTYITGNPVFSDLTVEASDGFVSTWYDQSGNNNHATQTFEDSQPKIVSAGSYLGELDFDGVDDFLECSNIGAYQSSDGSGVFCVLEKDTTSTSDVFSSTNPLYLMQIYQGSFLNTTLGFRIIGGKLDSFRRNAENTDFSITRGDTHLVDTDLTLLSQVGGQSIDLFKDGAELSLGRDESGLSLSLASPSLNMGSQDGNTRFIDGGIKELIFYNSDQSANRPAIEKNINNHYEIF